MLRDWLYIACEDAHDWRQVGGRRCPTADENEQRFPCATSAYPSQPVFQCSRCKLFDYGEPGGPGWQHCQDCARRAA